MARSKPSPEKIGDLAEEALLRWCTEADIVANKASKDRRGWDFYLDCPEMESPSYALRRRSRINCHVQVKGTVRDIRSVRVSLAHLERMISHPLPWFLVVVLLDATAPYNAKRVYAVHVGYEFAATMLEAQRERPSTPAHKKMVKATWAESDRLRANNGPALLERIRGSVGVQDQYVREKEGWLRKLRDARVATASFKFPDAATMFQAFAELAIGDRSRIDLAGVKLDPELLAEVAEVTKTPSLLGLKSTDFMSGGVSVNLDTSPRIFELSVRSPRGLVTLGAAFSLPQALFRFVPKEYEYYWIGTRFLDIKARNGRMNLRVSRLHGVAEFAELARTAAAIRLIEEGAVLVLSLRGKPALKAALGAPPEEFQREAIPFAHAVDDAAWLASYFGVDGGAVQLDIGALCAELPRFNLMRGLLDRNSGVQVSEITTLVPREALATRPKGRKKWQVTIFGVLQLELGPVVALCSLRLAGVAQTANSRRDPWTRIRVSRPELTVPEWRVVAHDVVRAERAAMVAIARKSAEKAGTTPVEVETLNLNGTTYRL